MKLNGTHKFKASSAQVFNAILNPEILKSSIPGSSSVSYVSPNSIQVELTTPLPGLRGPYEIVINIPRRQEPNFLEMQVVRQGKGGSVNALGEVNLADEADGALLSYNANADLEGPVSIANYPLGQGIVKNSLSSFFKNLEKAIEKAYV